jgi:hypothetical protein
MWFRYSLYKNEYRIFKPVKTTIRRELQEFIVFLVEVNTTLGDILKGM